MLLFLDSAIFFLFIAAHVETTTLAGVMNVTNAVLQGRTGKVRMEVRHDLLEPCKMRVPYSDQSVRPVRKKWLSPFYST